MSKSVQAAKGTFILGTTKASNLPWRSLARLGLAEADRAGSSIPRASAEHRSGVHTEPRGLLCSEAAEAGARLQARMLFPPSQDQEGWG